MRKTSKILYTLAGAGIIGMLTGCGAEEPMASMQAIVPEQVESSESAQRPSADSSRPGQISAPIDSTEIGKEENKSAQTNNTANSNVSPETASKENTSSEPAPGKTIEVIALADSEEAAKSIAQMYQIDLKSYSLGVAVYTTDKEFSTLLQLGRDNDYPTLSLNHEVQLY